MSIKHPSISLDSHVQLRPLSKQLENGVAVIGWRDQFLELPPEGLEFIRWLDDGLTVGEARKRFEARFNPFPDAELFSVMDAFLESDFIASVDEHEIAAQHAPPQPQHHWISEEWAQALFSTPALIAWLIFVIPAVGLWVTTPTLWPRYADYFWFEYNFVIVLVGLLLWLVDMPLHELAHLLACRAKGIEATITWTQRLGFIPMSQTIMHNIWAVPRRERYLPLSAGMMFDLVRISSLLYLLAAHHADIFTLYPLFTQFLEFYLLISTLSLTTQFWLFSRMDGYFLLSALLGQRNLQADTYGWLLSIVRGRPFEPPASGMKFIYIYSIITLLWGGLVVGQFLLITIPIKVRLVWESILHLNLGPANAPVLFADGVVVLTSQTIDLALLTYAYWRDTLPSLRSG